MSADLQRICIVGAGRMGEGIALAFMFAGLPVTLIDIKQRDDEAQDRYFRQVEGHLRGELATLARLGSLDPAQAEHAMNHLRLSDRERSGDDLQGAAVVFEAVPEVLELKAQTFAWLSAACGSETVIASTTSTFLVTQLAALVTHPQRFVNAHWLNPAFLMPLVEVSRSAATCPQVVQRLMALLKRIGKVPVQCSPAAGYIVPRIQALAMNEAARMVEEGVASAEDSRRFRAAFLRAGDARVYRLGRRRHSVLCLALPGGSHRSTFPAAQGHCREHGPGAQRAARRSGVL
jgi:3-hydroxybutyryl-CoA dehydrogenase